MKNIAAALLLSMGLISVGCVQKTSGSETEGVQATYKGPLRQKTQRHIVFAVSAPGSEGSKQCWYNVYSDWADKRTDAEVIKASGNKAKMSAGFLNLSTVETIVANEIPQLEKAVDDNIQKALFCSVSAQYDLQHRANYEMTSAYTSAQYSCSNSQNKQACLNNALISGCNEFHNLKIASSRAKIVSLKSGLESVKAEKNSISVGSVDLSKLVQTNKDYDANRLVNTLRALIEVAPSAISNTESCPAPSALVVK